MFNTVFLAHTLYHWSSWGDNPIGLWSAVYGALIIEAITRARHYFELPMRINREQTLYLVFETSDIPLLRHRSSHMRQSGQPAYQIVFSTAAKDTYLLSPVTLPPSQVTCCSSNANRPFVMSLSCCLWTTHMAVLCHFYKQWKSSTQASKQAFVTLFKLISFENKVWKALSLWATLPCITATWMNEKTQT